MTTPRLNTDRRMPQLIPHRLLRDSQSHHPAVLEEARDEARDFTCGWPIASPHSPAR